MTDICANLILRYDKCLINIKIISKINTFDRLIFGYDYVSIRRYTVFQGIYRFLSGETRNDIISGLNNICAEVEYIIYELYKIHDSARLKTLYTELKLLYSNDSKGLSALANTYKDDPLTFSKLEFIIEKIQTIVAVSESQRKISDSHKFKHD
jgi:hypothetical protein